MKYGRVHTASQDRWHNPAIHENGYISRCIRTLNSAGGEVPPSFVGTILVRISFAGDGPRTLQNPRVTVVFGSLRKELIRNVFYRPIGRDPHFGDGVRCVIICGV